MENTQNLSIEVTQRNRGIDSIYLTNQFLFGLTVEIESFLEDNFISDEDRRFILTLKTAIEDSLKCHGYEFN